MAPHRWRVRNTARTWSVSWTASRSSSRGGQPRAQSAAAAKMAASRQWAVRSRRTRRGDQPVRAWWYGTASSQRWMPAGVRRARSRAFSVAVRRADAGRRARRTRARGATTKPWVGEGGVGSGEPLLRYLVTAPGAAAEYSSRPDAPAREWQRGGDHAIRRWCRRGDSNPHTLAG